MQVIHTASHIYPWVSSVCRRGGRMQSPLAPWILISFSASSNLPVCSSPPSVCLPFFRGCRLCRRDGWRRPSRAAPTVLSHITKAPERRHVLQLPRRPLATALSHRLSIMACLEKYKRDAMLILLCSNYILSPLTPFACQNVAWLTRAVILQSFKSFFLTFTASQLTDFTVTAVATLGDPMTIMRKIPLITSIFVSHLAMRVAQLQQGQS